MMFLDCLTEYMTGDFRGDMAAPTWSKESTVASERRANLLKNKGFDFASLHGVQGVASSNPAVPTSNTLGG